MQYRWLLGTGGLYVEQSLGGGYGTLMGWRALLDPQLPRGIVTLLAVEWESDAPRS